MTFDQIVAQVMQRLDLTSDDAETRIGIEVNDRFKRLATSCGFNTIGRDVVTATTAIGSQYLTFLETVKVLSVFNTAFNPYQVLGKLTFQEIRNMVPGTDPAMYYADSSIDATSVTVFLNSIAASEYTLSADALIPLDTLSGSQTPAFPENFHSILVYGAMADELDKMEKYDFAAKKEAQWDQMSSDLRYFLAKSSYLDIYAAKDQTLTPWWSTSLVP